ncbi:MAG: hypothetical protein CMN78_02410 [Spirochaetales bacterium]|nr:hypothetical protein [Spirochaetales bacterium]
MSNVSDLLQTFSESWPSDRKDFRIEGDESWKAYAATLRDIVAEGDVEAASQGLHHENKQVKALTVRALGFLREPKTVPALANILSADDWATCRLIAADSLGMIGTKDARDALGAAVTSEDSADVALHIEIALGRSSGLESGALADLKKIDDASLGKAAIGNTAPDFTLTTADESVVTMLDYRDKQPVALYFLYGDG